MPIHVPSFGFIFLILLVIMVAMTITFSEQIKKFFRWLKGSRETYYFDQNRVVRSSPRKLRTPIDRVGIGMADPHQGVIEISRGWFRRRTAIYGDYHVSYWKIMGNGVPVDLTDGRGISVTAALRLINTYTSLQAVLDDLERTKTELKLAYGYNEEFRKRREYDTKLIAKLDRELDEQRSLRRSLEYGVGVILAKIEEDRQRYRSKPSQNIRQCLEALRHIIAKYMNGHSETFPKTVAEWQDEFEAALRSGFFKAH